MNTWEEDTKQGDWRFYTGTYTAIVWQRIDGWWIKVGLDKTQTIIEDRGGFKSLEEAQHHCEQFINNSESQSSECKGTENNE